MTAQRALTTVEAEATDDGWLTLWLNQPEARNVLSDALMREMEAVLASVRDDRDVRGITLRGRGGIFSAGGDIKSFNKMVESGVTEADVLALSRRGGHFFALVANMPQCIVAIVEGAAVAGGLGLACCCDIVLAEDGAVFATSETRIGLSPAQIAPYVIQRLGPAVARRLMLSSTRLNAREAYRLGLVDALAADATGLEAMETQVKGDILACAPGAVADVKAWLLELPHVAGEARIEAAAQNFKRRFLSDEGREGVSAFLGRREPNWRVPPGAPSARREPRSHG